MKYSPHMDPRGLSTDAVTLRLGPFTTLDRLNMIAADEIATTVDLLNERTNGELQSVSHSIVALHENDSLVFYVSIIIVYAN